MTFYLVFFSAHFHGNQMRFSLILLSTFLIQWFPEEGLKFGGAQNNWKFLLLFLPKSGGALAPLSPAYPVSPALLNCERLRHSGLINISPIFLFFLLWMFDLLVFLLTFFKIETCRKQYWILKPRGWKVSMCKIIALLF